MKRLKHHVKFTSPLVNLNNNNPSSKCIVNKFSQTDSWLMHFLYIIWCLQFEKLQLHHWQFGVYHFWIFVAGCPYNWACQSSTYYNMKCSSFREKTSYIRLLNNKKYIRPLHHWVRFWLWSKFLFFFKLYSVKCRYSVFRKNNL